MNRSNPSGSPLTAADLQETYARRFGGQESRRTKVWEVLCQHFIQRWVRPEDAVLDLGAGYCEFINSVRANKKFALDLNPATTLHAAADVTVLSQDVSKTWDLPSSSLDIVFTSNFLEHLENKKSLVHCLRESSRLLRPGGRFIALGPNIRYAYKVYWDYFDHYLALSDKSLVEALETNGFKAEVVIPRFLPFTMNGNTLSHPFLVRLYLLLSIAWPVFGRQFLIVASK